MKLATGQLRAAQPCRSPWLVSVDAGNNADVLRSMLARNLQIFTALLGIALTIILGQYLPDRVATHFSFSGQPNAWSSNFSSTAFYCSVIVFINALFLSIPWLLRKLPVSLINIPHREYWFAPERREETIGRTGSHMAEFSIGVNLFLIAIEYLTFVANKSAVPLSQNGMMATGVCFLVFLVVWMIRFVRAFRLPVK